MLMADNKKYYNVAGIQVNDPSINEDDTMQEGKTFEVKWPSITSY